MNSSTLLSLLISITLGKLMKTRERKRKALLPDTKLTKDIIKLIFSCDLARNLAQIV